MKKTLLILTFIIFVGIFIYGFFYQNITYNYNSSSNACYGGNIFYQNKFTKNIIFSSENSFLFPYCTPKVEKIDSNNYNIFICYESGAGSGECPAIKFIYNSKNNEWKYLNNGYFSLTLGYNNIEKTYENNEGILDFIKFVNQKKYNFIFK